MAKSEGKGTGAAPKGSSRVANVFAALQSNGMVPGYAPESVGAVAHKAEEPEVIWVEIDRILDSPYQHQEFIDPEDLQALVMSIQSEGFLTALNVNQHPERGGYYFLTAGGHQRRDAAKAAGKTKLPVFVEPRLDPIRLALRAAKENAVQVNRSPINQGHLFIEIQDKFALTQEEIAEELHRDRNYVKFCIMAARSDADIQEMLYKKPDSMRAMIYLRRLDTAEARAPIITQFLAGELSTEGVQAAVDRVLEQHSSAPHLSGGGGAAQVQRRNGGAGAAQLGESSTSAEVQSTLLTSKEGNPIPAAPLLSLPVKPPNPEHTHLISVPGRAAPPAPATASADYQALEREGKLKAIISRMETYKNQRGVAALSARERDYLEQLAAMCQMLLGEY
jgi:ParB/RepB/Spo0J family partition protein